jgi:hypothetical protein
VALWLWISTTTATDLLLIIRYYRFPLILVDEITELVNKGRKKGYTADNEKEVLDFLKEIHIAPAYDLSSINELANKR